MVLGARLGSGKDFDSIVKAYGGPIYGYAASELGRGPEAEDAVQEIFLKAFLGLRGLRESSRFEAWLYAIARNETRTRRRRRALAPEEVELDLDSLPEAESAGGKGIDPADAGLLLSRLSPGQARILRLRFWTELSVREIALVEGIPEKLAKSRLWEAMELLRRKDKGPRRRTELPPGFGEVVMDKVQLYRNAGKVFESLGLADQVGMAVAARKGERWDAGILASLGRISGGSDFARDFDAKLGMRELAEIVNCCDRFTEKRLVEELERLDPGTAEEIKRQMFVFEDFSLFDEGATRLLFEEVDIEVLALACSGIERRVRDIILGRLTEEGRKAAEAAIAASDPAPERVRAAQEEAVAWAYAADKAGRFRCLDRSSLPSGAPFFTLA